MQENTTSMQKNAILPMNSSSSVLFSSDKSCLFCLSVGVCSEVIYVALVEDSVQLTFT